MWVIYSTGNKFLVDVSDFLYQIHESLYPLFLCLDFCYFLVREVCKVLF